MDELDQLDDMDPMSLKAAWLDVFGRPPPTRASVKYMRSVLAYRLQEQSGAKLSASTRRKLVTLASAFNQDSKHRSAATVRIKEGVKILREWNGNTHQVTVLAEGFEYKNRRYRSLSAIAREITGTRRSGPAFFGLKGKADAA
jgi:hypothetical protein